MNEDFIGMRESLYDEICRTLTDYENPQDASEPVMGIDLYNLLVKIQNEYEENLIAFS